MEHAQKLHPDVMREVLNNLVLKPRMKGPQGAAAKSGLHPTTLYTWIGRSQRGDPELQVSWLGVVRPFHEHVNVARKLSVVALDHSARDQAINGWSEPRYHDGEPVYKRDPVLAADALDPERWALLHGDRDINDTYARDIDGGLIQEQIVHPPNPALLVKMLASLAPDLYGDRATIEHHHTGHVWIEGDTSRQKQITSNQDQDFAEDFALTKKPDPKSRPTNVLAIPAPCATAEEFDQKFLVKQVREVTLFRDAEGKLELPLADDVIVAGSYQDIAFTAAGIRHATVTAESLIIQGYKNPFLLELAARQEPEAEVSPVSVTPEPEVEQPVVEEDEQPTPAPVPQPAPSLDIKPGDHPSIAALKRPVADRHAKVEEKLAQTPGIPGRYITMAERRAMAGIPEPPDYTSPEDASEGVGPGRVAPGGQKIS